MPDRFTVLYQGPPKSGKTHCALSWPNPGVLYTETNLATARKLVDEGRILLPHRWNQDVNELELKIIPKLEARKADEVFGHPVDTIVLDSMTEALAMVQRDIQGSKEKMSINDFGRFLVRGETLVRRLIALAQPQGQHPGYHVVMTVHERDVTDDAGGLVRVTPAIMGQLKDLVARFFDTVLVCEAHVETKMENTPTGSIRTRTIDYRVWSVPPDDYHTCGDGVGGGRLKRLPASLDGTYPTLAKAWGVE